MPSPDRDIVLNAIKTCANSLSYSPSRSEFIAFTGMTRNQVLKHFPSWNKAVRAAGLEPNRTTYPVGREALLADWGEVVRRMCRIPTRRQYRKTGKYNPSSLARKFGSWSRVPKEFREWASELPAWADVIALLPLENGRPEQQVASDYEKPILMPLKPTHQKLYGNPIDFRGLRHEPINENGVVFLFGMVARELGFYVEAVQAGYPDCEAKRQVRPGKWERVRIEFEFESRNFRDHKHPIDGCDIIVCWRHNWLQCPSSLEVLDLGKVIQTLASSED